MDKNVAQFEGKLYTTNPGNFGHGIPSLTDSVKDTLRALRKSLHRQNANLGRNAVLAGLANVWNFTFRGGSRKVACNCCGWKGAAMIAAYTYRAVAYESICPGCSSRSRHRGLLNLYDVELDRTEGKLILFGPEKVIQNYLQRFRTTIEVRSADKFVKGVDFEGEDIRSLSFPNASFDYILCNHVLEHVQDDDPAFRECARILKRGGKAIFTIPGDFDKYATRVFAEQDDNGHFRHYGMDVVEKMKKYFAFVRAIDLHTVSQPEHRVRRLDYAFICGHNNTER